MSININSLLSNPWVRTIGSGLILALILALFKNSLFGGEKKEKWGNKIDEVSPVFWRLRKYKIQAVHKYIKSDDPSGYHHESQNSRQDQWQELIDIRTSFFKIRHEIIPRDKKDILSVVISRNGREKWKTISFNK